MKKKFATIDYFADICPYTNGWRSLVRGLPGEQATVILRLFYVFIRDHLHWSDRRKFVCKNKIAQNACSGTKMEMEVLKINKKYFGLWPI